MPHIQAHMTVHGARADVSYHPAGCEAPLLRHINMEIRNNSLSLVYGRSGSGKTTLLQLLSGLRQQTSGSVCMIKGDGAPLWLPFRDARCCVPHSGWIPCSLCRRAKHSRRPRRAPCCQRFSVHLV